MIIESPVSISLVASLAMLCLGGCAGPAVKLDSSEHQALLKADRTQAEQGARQQKISLTLDQALERGVRANLDARVAAMEILIQQKEVTLEQLKALPALNASVGYVGRSNDGSSSSRSIQSGLQSLEPSQSSDRDRRTASLELNWNLLDVALAYTDAKKAGDEARVARARHEKVIQNIQRDVYAAYWRAYAYQATRADTGSLIADAESQIGKINEAVSKRLLSADAAGDQIAQLSDRVRTLNELEEQLNLSGIELKSMLALPLDAELALSSPENYSGNYKSLLNQNLEAQEWEALKNRPEIREEILQKNLTLRDSKREILTTFPGLELFAGANYDTNSFLSDSTWLNSSAKIVQSLISIFTLPTRLEAAKNKEALADARRQALVAAVLAQTNIARQRLLSREQVLQNSAGSLKAAGSKASLLAHKKATGFAPGATVLQAKLEQQIEVMRNQMARADLQDSYAAYMNTLGRRFFRPVNLMAGGAT